LLRPFASVLVGFLWAWIQVCQVLCTPFPETLVRRDLGLTGRIAGLPRVRQATAAHGFCSRSGTRVRTDGPSASRGWCA